MITEIQIYTDTSVISLDEYKALVPIASGSWNVIKLIYTWLIDPYPSRIPDECKIKSCDIYIIDRSHPNIKIPITIHTFKLIGNYLCNVNTDVNYAKIIDNYIPLIEESHEK